MMHQRIKRWIPTVLLFVMLLSMIACTNTDVLSDVTTDAQTVMNNPPMSTVAASDTESDTTEDTAQVSSQPYSLQHHVYDFSDQLPSYVPKTMNDTPKNIHVDENGLHMYVNDRQTAQANIYTFHSDRQETTITQVPPIDEKLPLYAYQLTGGQWLMVAKKTYNYYLFYTENDGTVVAEYPFYNSTAPDGCLVSEEENGDVNVMVGCMQNLDMYRYEKETSAFVMERHIDQNSRTENRRLDVLSAQYVGNGIYYGSSYESPVKLDMKTGTLNAQKLRISKDQNNFRIYVGADGNFYLSNDVGLYLYSDDIPTKVLDWVDCNINRVDYTVWIVNSHTFYFMKIADVHGESTVTLQLVTTERVPYEEERETINIIGFVALQEAWLTDAIFQFNRINQEYRVNLRLISTVDRSHEDINDEVAEMMLYQDHPDIFLFAPSAWRPLDIYYEKNVFVDLMPYFGDDLLTCAAEGMTWNGALYTLPTTMQLQTFVCADTVTDSALTWEKFYSVIDSVSVPDSILTTEPNVIDYIYNNGIMDFCNVDQAESYYDTDAFCNMLTTHQKLAAFIDKNFGIIEQDVLGSYGYTRAALPANLQAGNIKFLNVPVSKLNDILAPMLLYGDNDFTWCGYPSRDGGGAYLRFSDMMFSVFADSDAVEGCIEFLSYLLSDEWQCHPTLEYLPVTESGLRAMITDNRYWYYRNDIYNKYSDPNAELEPAPFYGSLSGLKYIPTRAVDSSAELLPQYQSESYITVELTSAYADAFIEFLNRCHMKANVDNTLKSIINEEISYWENGVRTLNETVEIIDSRVWIYLNE